jgi:sulfhydrogenase subunit alpha
VPQLQATVDLFKTFAIPDFVRETEFVALKGEDDYPWIGGQLVSTDGVVKPERDYLAMTNEWVDGGNTTKWCKLSRGSFAVGALARVNNNFRLLRPEAAEVAKVFDLSPVNHNPFMCNVAQLVEIVHVVYEAVGMIDEVLGWPEGTELMADVKPGPGRGVGAVEVPRGILYHCYEYDADGRVARADCVIPTTQNNLNIHHDMGALAKQYSREPGMTDESLELLCSMLVRSYDPCISCSVH